jgi:hypothetical protein
VIHVQLDMAAVNAELAPSAQISAIPGDIFADDEPVSAPLAGVRRPGGKGTATLDVIANQFGSPVWELNRVRYNFEPVSERATLLLFGTGMLALARRRHRHRSRPPDRNLD